MGVAPFYFVSCRAPRHCAYIAPSLHLAQYPEPDDTSRHIFLDSEQNFLETRISYMSANPTQTLSRRLLRIAIILLVTPPLTAAVAG